jgi:hypothetical protein
MWAVTRQSFASTDTAIIEYTIESGNDSNELLIGVIGTGQVYGNVDNGTLDEYVVFKNLNGNVIEKGNGNNSNVSGYNYTSDTDIKIVWSNNTIELWTEGILRVSYSVVNANASNYHFVVSDNTTTSSSFTIKINDTATINMKTSTAGLRIRDSSNDYMVFNTTDEKIELKQDLSLDRFLNIGDTTRPFKHLFDTTLTNSFISFPSSRQIIQTNAGLTDRYWQTLEGEFAKTDTTEVTFRVNSNSNGILYFGVAYDPVRTKNNSTTSIEYLLGYRLIVNDTIYDRWETNDGGLTVDATTLSTITEIPTDVNIRWSNGTIELYCDGTLRDTYTPTSTKYTNSPNLRFIIGDNYQDSSFDISIVNSFIHIDSNHADSLVITDDATRYMTFNTRDNKVEIKQDLEVTGNVNGSTISDTQWGYLGAMDQSVATTDDVTFNKITSETFEQTKLTLAVSSSTPRFTLQPNRLHIIPNTGSMPSIGYLELDASILESGDRIEIISQYAGDLRVVKKDGGDNLTEILANGSNIAWNDDNTYFQLPRFTCARIIIHNTQRFNIKTCSRFGDANVSNTQWGYLGAMDQPVATTDVPTFVGTNLNTTTYNGGDGVNEIIVPDTLADALSIKDSTNDYLIFNTSEQKVEIKQDLEATGNITVIGNIGDIILNEHDIEFRDPPQLYSWDPSATLSLSYPNGGSQVVKAIDAVRTQAYTIQTFDASGRAEIEILWDEITGSDALIGVIDSAWTSTNVDLVESSGGSSEYPTYSYIYGKVQGQLRNAEFRNTNRTLLNGDGYIFTTGDVVRLVYDNKKFRYYVNGSLVYTTTRPNAFGTLKFTVVDSRTAVNGFTASILPSVSSSITDDLSFRISDVVTFDTINSKTSIKSVIEFPVPKSGINEIVIPNSVADALSIQDSSVDYMVFNTTDQKVEIKQDLEISGAILPTITSINNTNSPYTILSSDNVILVDTSTASVTITLPDTSSFTGSRKYTIKDIGNASTNSITINRSGSDTIDGSTSLTISTDYVAYNLVTDGIANWYVI